MALVLAYLEVFFKTLTQGIGNLMKPDEFLYAEHLRVVPGCAGIQALNDGRNVTKDAGIHEGCLGRKNCVSLAWVEKTRKVD